MGRKLMVWKEDRPYQALFVKLHNQAVEELGHQDGPAGPSLQQRRMMMEAQNAMLDAAVTGREDELLEVGMNRYRDLRSGAKK